MEGEVGQQTLSSHMNARADCVHTSAHEHFESWRMSEARLT